MNKLIFLLFFPICAIAQQFTAIEKVNVVDVVNDKIVPAQTVLIKDSVIYLIGENIKIPAGARIINAKDQYLIPGLIDTHIHLPWDLDSIMEISTWDQLKYLYLVNGITSVRDASMRGLHKESIAAAKTITAVIPRISVSGRLDANRLKATGLDASALTEELIKAGVKSIKIRHGLTVEDVRAATAVAKKYNIPVWGHTYYKTDYTLESIDAGVKGVTHIMGIPPRGSIRRSDTLSAGSADGFGWWIFGATHWLYTDSAAATFLIQKMVTNNVWLEPTLITEDYVVNESLMQEYPAIKRSKKYQQLREGFPQPKGYDHENYRLSIEAMKRFVKQFHDEGGVIISGSDGIPFPGFGIHEELRLLVDAGISPADALKSATISAAKVLNWDDIIGSVYPGKRADLVLLDGDPLKDISNRKKIAGVFINGVRLTKHELQSLKKKAVQLLQ